MNLQAFLSQLSVAATSPYALFAYLFLITANLIIALRLISNRTLSNNIGKLPPNERAAAFQQTTGVVLPKNITAEEWLKGRKHQYFLFAFLTAVICITTVIIITVAEPAPSPKDWKSKASIDKITPGTNREFITSLLGEGKRIELSEVFSTPYSVTGEVYKDVDSEIQLLYKDNIIIGEIFREFNGPTISKTIWGSGSDHSPWVLGAAKFSDLNHGADEVFERDHNGKSICRIEKHYFGAPGNYQDYYFSHNLILDEEDIPIEKMRPDSMMIVNTDELCNADGPPPNYEECKKMLRMLVCTPSSDIM